MELFSQPLIVKNINSKLIMTPYWHHNNKFVYTVRSMVCTNFKWRWVTIALRVFFFHDFHCAWVSMLWASQMISEANMWVGWLEATQGQRSTQDTLHPQTHSTHQRRSHLLVDFRFWNVLNVQGVWEPSQARSHVFVVIGLIKAALQICLFVCFLLNE